MATTASAADAEQWIARVRAAHGAAVAARATEEQTIRDAADAGVPPTSIAREGLGTQNKGRVYAVLGRGSDGGTPAAPALTPVVYLRGAGNGEGIWERVRAAMWARGWAVEDDRTSAWHLARGGVPVVACDFSADLDDAPGQTRGDLYVVVERIRARYGEYSMPGTVADLLSTPDAVRHINAPWTQEPVTLTNQEYELVPINSQKRPRPTRWHPDAPNNRGDTGAWGLDENALARMVAEAFDG